MKLLVTSRTPASLPRSWAARCVPSPRSTRGSTYKTFVLASYRPGLENLASGLGGSAETKCQSGMSITNLCRNGSARMLQQMQPCSLLCTRRLWAITRTPPTTSLRPPDVHAWQSASNPIKAERYQNNLILFPFPFPHPFFHDWFSRSLKSPASAVHMAP